MTNRFFLLLFATVFFIACKGNEDVTQRYPAGWAAGVQTSREIRQFLNSMMPRPHVIDMDPRYQITEPTPSGVQLNIPELNFRNTDGTTISKPPVSFVVYEFANNSELLTGSISTGSSDGRVLQSGRVLRVDMVGPQGQKMLLKAPIIVRIPYTGPQNPDYQLFSGIDRGLDNPDAADPNLVSWNEDTSRLFWVNGYPQFPMKYPNLHYVAAYPRERGQGFSTIEVALPEGYGNTNAMVAILLPETGHMQLSGYAASATFQSKPYKIPVGATVNLLCIGKKNGQFAYSYQPVTIGTTNNIKITALKPVTQDSLVSFIRTGL